MRVFVADRVLVDGRFEVGHAVGVDGDGRIAGVGPIDQFPADSQQISLPGTSIVPGLMDLHVHLLGIRGEAREETIVDPALRAARAAGDARAMLEAGFTTVRDCGSPVSIGVGRAVAEGSIPGPRIFAAGRFIEPTGGADDPAYLPLELVRRGMGPLGPSIADGASDVRRAVREEIRAGAAVIKTCSTGAVHSSSSDPGALEWTDEELEALIDEAHRHGRRVAVHAHAPEGIRQAIRLGGDSIEHGMLLDEPMAKIMADSKVPLVPTVTAFFLLGSDEATDAATRLRARAHGWKERHVEAFKTALAAGVRIATGSDCAGEPFFPFGANAREIEIMVDYGMSPLAALEASTVTAAATIGREDVGAIRPGMTADLLVVDGNPEQDISSLRRPILVTQGGRIAVDKRAASPLPLTA